VFSLYRPRRYWLRPHTIYCVVSVAAVGGGGGALVPLITLITYIGVYTVPLIAYDVDRARSPPAFEPVKK
jgi:hypothetical protein